MTYWGRIDTQEWIAQLENRIDDIKYYINETTKWCELNEVYNDKLVSSCVLLTVVWVTHQRSETITKQELFEILGVKGWEELSNDSYGLAREYEHMDHIELLEMIVRSF